MLASGVALRRSTASLPLPVKMSRLVPELASGREGSPAASTSTASLPPPVLTVVVMPSGVPSTVMVSLPAPVVRLRPARPESLRL